MQTSAARMFTEVIKLLSLKFLMVFIFFFFFIVSDKGSQGLV